MTVEEFILKKMRARFLEDGAGPDLCVQSEKELAAQYGVCVKTMRRVLIGLEEEGLLRIPESEELKLSVRETIALFEAREAIEGMAARLVVRRGLDPGEAKHLRGLAESIDLYRMDEYQVQYEKKFHQRVVELSGNSLLVRMHSIVIPILTDRLPDRESRHDVLAPPEEMKQLHVKLVDILLEGSEEDAERVFREHCTKVVSFMIAEAHGSQ